MSTPHNLRWGECLKATPPPPVPVTGSPVDADDPVIPEEDEEEDEEGEQEKMIEIYSDDGQEDTGQEPESSVPIAAAMYQDSGYVSVDKMKKMPHVCITLSDAATAGSYSELTDTDVPESTGVLSDDDDLDSEFDEDFVVHAGFPENDER